MAEKLFENVDQLFEEKPMWTSETRNVGLKIPDFLKKIEEKKVVLSPKFNFSGDTDGVDFELRVKAGSENPQSLSSSAFSCLPVKRIKSLQSLSWRGLVFSLAGRWRKFYFPAAWDTRISCLSLSSRPGLRLTGTCSC